MYTVIIVDDEPSIREGLKTLIPWNNYGFNVIAIAKNGIEGIQLYQQFSPNLMIVDIRMPKMDGLTMINELRKKDINLQFLILSGFADFDYAKRAIGAGAAGYLLKPLDEDELIESIQMIHRKLEEEKEYSRYALFEEKQKTEYFIQSLISPDFSELDSQVKTKQLELGLTNVRMQVLLIDTNKVQDRKLESCKESLRSMFEKTQRAFVFEKNNQLGLLLIYKPGVPHLLSSIYDEIKLGLEEKRLIISCGDIVYNLKAVYNSFENASILMEYHFYFSTDVILEAKEHKLPCQTTIEENSYFSPEAYIGKLFYAFELVDIILAEKTLLQLFEELKSRYLPEKQIKVYTLQIYSGSLNKLLAGNHGYKSFISKQLAKGVQIYDMDSLPALKAFMIDSCKEVIRFLDDGSTDILVKKMTDFIQKQYDQNLRLESLAEIFNYNSAYLGKLFRNHTGLYFNTFLDQVRIEKGKELLIKGYKVYETAELIGYANVDYFHKKFRQYTGISPSQYRKQMKDKIT